MAKKFVRSITGIKDINKQDLSTNNVGDLLSDGKDVYVHRKNGAKEEYFNLTSDKGDKYIADGDSGLEIWQKEGEDGKRIKLSQEFLKNNAQFISTEENSGLKATPRQDKYGKSYEIGFTDEAKAKMEDVVNKVNNIPQGGKSKPIKITEDWSKNNMTATETDNAITLGLNDRVLTADNFKGGSSTNGSVKLVECSWLESDDTGTHKYPRQGWGLMLNENYWLTRQNLLVTKDSGLLYNNKNDKNTSFATLDIDSTKLLRHDSLLGDEAKGIKVSHTDGETTSSISLTDDVWAKIQKIDSLNGGGGSATAVNVVGDGETITVQDNSTGEKVVSLKADYKTKVNKVDDIEQRVETLENNQGGGSTEAFAPEYKFNSPANGVNAFVFGLPYTGAAGKYLAIVTLQCDRIDSASPVKLKAGMVYRWLSKLPLPTSGYYQNGSILLKKESDNSISITTTGSEDATKFTGVFQVVLDSIR